MTHLAHPCFQASPTRAPSPNGRNRQGGYSLLEVLVAILLVSIGLLGMAGLSAATYGYNKSAQLRLVGLALVNDYADRARVNVYGYDRSGYNIAIGDTIPTTSPTMSANADQVVQATAADAVATYDKAQFMYAVANRLPSGRAVVERNATAQSRGMNIWLLWKEPDAASGDALLQAVQSNCPSSATTGYSCISFKVGL